MRNCCAYAAIRTPSPQVLGKAHTFSLLSHYPNTDAAPTYSAWRLSSSPTMLGVPYRQSTSVNWFRNIISSPLLMLLPSRYFLRAYFRRFTE